LPDPFEAFHEFVARPLVQWKGNRLRRLLDGDEEVEGGGDEGSESGDGETEGDDDLQTPWCTEGVGRKNSRQLGSRMIEAVWAATIVDTETSQWRQREDGLSCLQDVTLL
jgi:hypothetical protein